MSDEKFGAVVVGLLGVVLLCLLARVSWSGSPVALVRVLLGLAAAFVVLRVAAGRPGGRAARPGRAAGGRMVSGHAHGDRRFIARHEAGHVVAARALGGRVISATANAREGLVSARLPNNPRARIAFLRAGGHAVRSGRGCQDDRAAERRALREVPWGQRGRLLREADRDARRIVNQNRGQIRRDARTLERRGSL